MRKKGRAKNLAPRECEICKDIFQPYTCRQKICGKKECQREYDIVQARKFYYKVKEREKDRNAPVLPELRRKFEVCYIKKDQNWYWKATGDNGSILENGPFCTRQEAKEDFQLATE